jgi:hypothetical protein
MINLKQKVVLLAVAALMAAPSAFASARFSIAGALDYPLSNTTVGPITLKGNLGFGGGLLVGFPMGSSAMFEFGGIYLSRGLKSTFSGVDTTTTVNLVNIPGKIYFGSKGFMFGVGGYYDYYTASGASGDYGVGGNLRFNFGSGTNKFFTDFGVGMSMKADSWTAGTKAMGATALIGMTFGK